MCFFVCETTDGPKPRIPAISPPMDPKHKQKDNERLREKDDKPKEDKKPPKDHRGRRD
eukprot:m.499408 g.499408  ORF g.499408 m.499408 type:complete len:58 (+) comp57322_c0_seq3:55-228(+)